MNIRETVFNLLKVYDEMTVAFSQFQKDTDLPCLSSCGKCCITPDIESTVLECLPFDLSIYDEGKMDEWIARLEQAGKRCALWEGNPMSGMGKCTSYETRPSLCRMFGVAGTFDKNHKVTLSVCRPIREESPKLVQIASEERNPQNTPIMSHWFARVEALGTRSILERRPINQSLLEALRLVGLHSQYQEL